MRSQALGNEEIARRVHALIERYRARCLWFIRDDDLPGTPGEAVCTTAYIERNVDRGG